MKTKARLEPYLDLIMIEQKGDRENRFTFKVTDREARAILAVARTLSDYYSQVSRGK